MLVNHRFKMKMSGLVSSSDSFMYIVLLLVFVQFLVLFITDLVNTTGNRKHTRYKLRLLLALVGVNLIFP